MAADATGARGHGMLIPAPDATQEMPHACLARMALEVLWTELFYRADLAALGPEEQAVSAALHDLHALLWEREMQAVAATGLTAHYLIIRPLSPLSLPAPGHVAEIRDAIATLIRHDLIARGWSDG
jgi:hypothetical protein